MDGFNPTDDVDVCYDALKMEDSIIKIEDVNMDEIQDCAQPISFKRLRNSLALPSYDTQKWPDRSRNNESSNMAYMNYPLKIPKENYLSCSTDYISASNECLHSNSNDIFQVDKRDLIQDGPTLAELNATDDNLFDDLSFDDFVLLEEKNSTGINRSNGPLLTEENITSTLASNSQFGTKQPQLYVTPQMVNSMPNYPSSPLPPLRLLSPDSLSLSPSPVEIGVRFSNSSEPKNNSTLHQLLISSSPSKLRKIISPKCISPEEMPPAPRQVPFISQHSDMRLCSSAPTHSFMETIWQHREPRTHLLSTGSLIEDSIRADSASSLSTDLLSPTSFDDDEYNSEGSDQHFDSSDNSKIFYQLLPIYCLKESDESEARERNIITAALSKREKYFWQYNVQSKGPKGQRIVMNPGSTDPHVLHVASDPVFNPSVSVKGIRHSGKARRGDGNDLTPNPRKLYNIGKELDKLFDIINDMTPVSELPISDRGKTRKEKNKLASRACRLKKKAQHEANKIKVYGLEQEHRRLMEAIHQVRTLLLARILSQDNIGETLQLIEKISKNALTEFVNRVIDRVKEGDPRGGLEELSGSKASRLKKLT